MTVVIEEVVSLEEWLAQQLADELGSLDLEERFHDWTGDEQ